MKNVPQAFAVSWTAGENWSIIRKVSNRDAKGGTVVRCRLWVSIWAEEETTSLP